MALIALEKYEEAIDCCTRCLEYDPDNKGVQSVLERVSKLKAAKDKKEQERQQRLWIEQQAKIKMHNALKVSSSPLLVTEALNSMMTLLEGTKHICPTQTRWVTEPLPSAL